MPEMDRDRWRAPSLRLDEALELSEDQRDQWMSALGGEAPGLADDGRVRLEEDDVMRREVSSKGTLRLLPGS